jgi:hypothetical protein
VSAAPRAAVVDPWGGGALLAPALRRHGHECFAVLSDAGIAARLGAAPPPAGDFVEVLTHQDDAAATAERLRQRGVELVLAGCETGVLLADQLDAALGLAGNGLALSPARRDKGLMAQAAADAGLAVPRQTRSADVEAILEWIGATGYPVVIKPPHSLDSDGVALCSSAGEVHAACAALLGRTNQAGLINETVLVQERLDGDQYAVDTVSRDGRHLLAGIWRYSRPRLRPGATAYAAIGSDGKRMVDAMDERSQRLFAFTCRLLDALGIRVGPAHCELMWVGDGPVLIGPVLNGPVLIEIGARLHGGEKTPLISRLCTGSSQLDRALEARLDPARFDAALDRPYPLRQHGAMVYLMPWRTGHLQGYGRLRDVTALPSFLEVFNLAAPGPLTRRVAGLVTLIHPDPDVLSADIARLRAFEADGLYLFQDAA